MKRYVVLAALAATVVGAAPAEAALLKGTVTGSPYVGTPTTSAVPVLFSKQSAKRAGMRSPVGVIIVPRGTAVPVPGPEAKVLPGRLRLGDRFRINARVPREARRAVYTRLSVKRGFTITKRSKTLSNDELAAQIAQLRADLTAVASFTSQLHNFTVKGFNDLNARVDRLERDIRDLRASIASLQRQLGALTDQLAALRADLERQIANLDAKLAAQLATLTAALAALEAKLGDLSAACGSGPHDTRTVAGQLCALKSALPTDGTLTTITSLTTRIDSISSGLTSTLNTLTGLNLTGDLTGPVEQQVQETLRTIFGLTGNLGSLAKQVDLTAATDAIALVDEKVGAPLPNGQTLSGLVSSLNGQMANVKAAIGANPDGSTSTTLDAQIKAARDSVQAGVDAITLYLSPGDGGTLGGSNDLLATQIAGVTGKIDGVRTSVRTTCADAQAAINDIRNKLAASLLVSGQSAPVVDLSGTKIGTASVSGQTLTVLSEALTGMSTACSTLP